MSLIKLNTVDFNEFIFNMDELKKAYQDKKEYFNTNYINSSKIKGSFNLSSTAVGNIYYSKSLSKFDQDICVKSNGGIKNVSLHFIKKGGDLFSINERTKCNLRIASNTCNMFFMQEEVNEVSIVKKELERETIGLHLPIPYFENLVKLYPELFEESFNRFQNGESFYLHNNFKSITYEMYHILSQIENSMLIGNSITPYVDAKVLELLYLQFHTPKTTINKDNYLLKDIDKIKEAAAILTADIHNSPTVRELGLKVGINEKKIKQGFKIVFNTTVYGYLFDYKMQLAKQLLKDSQQTISEVAIQCGYNYVSHFCTAFKRKFGVSPLKMNKHL